MKQVRKQGSKQTPLQRFVALVRRASARVWALVVALGVVLGVAAAAYPRLSVSSSSPLNPTDPFSTGFTISNDGFFSIHDVKFACSLNDVKGHVGEIPITIEDVEVDLDAPISKIEASEKATFKCRISFSQTAPDLSVGDLSIDIDFRPAYVPMRMKKSYRFVTARGSDGQYYWQPQPLAKTR